MDNELIGRVLNHFIASRSRVEQAILGQRAYLQDMADRGKLSEAYAEVMNTLLGSMADHMEAIDEVLSLIGLDLEADPELFGNNLCEISYLVKSNQLMTEIAYKALAKQTTKQAFREAIADLVDDDDKDIINFLYSSKPLP